ncbi:MAG: class II aldolase/adducin family protein, partial [Chloroflexota bacterium]
MTDQTYDVERRVLARVAGMLYDRRLTELQGGNMSLRVGDAAVLTPTKASENAGWRLAHEDMLVQDLDGNVLVGDPAHISREIRLHLRLYREYTELGSVFHLHLAESLGVVASGRWGPGVV